MNLSSKCDTIMSDKAKKNDVNKIGGMYEKI